MGRGRSHSRTPASLAFAGSWSLVLEARKWARIHGKVNHGVSPLTRSFYIWFCVIGDLYVSLVWCFALLLPTQALRTSCEKGHCVFSCPRYRILQVPAFPLHCVLLQEPWELPASFTLCLGTLMDKVLHASFPTQDNPLLWKWWGPLL